MDTERATLIQQRIDELASLSDHEKHISRQFGSPAFLEAAQKIKEWMEEAGLQTRIDAAGNVRGRYSSSQEDAKIFIVGSHYDTITNAGKFDGALGILVGIDIAAYFISQNTALPYHLEIVAFSEGEGARFHAAYLGSKALAGLFDEQLLYLKDEEGNTLRQVLESMHTSFTQISEDYIPREDWLGFLDVHLEPGNVLFSKKLPVGVASAIYGLKRIDIQFKGEAGHAGTVPLDIRRDALAAAAKFVLKVESYALKDRNNVMATIGLLEVLNATTNVIPAKVSCSLDLRSMDKGRINEAYEELYDICESICHKRNIYFEWKLLQETPPVTFDSQFNEVLQEIISSHNLEYKELVSGATSEASVIFQVAPVCTLFVRGAKGISHNPNEFVQQEDIGKAVAITEDFLQSLGKVKKQTEALSQETSIKTSKSK